MPKLPLRPGFVTPGGWRYTVNMNLHKTAIRIVAWVVSVILAILLYVPIIAALVETPFHDESVLPSNTMMLIALMLSVGISIVSTITIQKWLSKFI